MNNGWYKLGCLVCGALLMVGCGSHKEDVAFERYMDDLFVEATHTPISELNFEIMDKSGVEYTSAQSDLYELALIVSEFDKRLLVGVSMLGGDDAEVNGAVNSMVDSYGELMGVAEGLAVACRLDVDSAMELYNRHRMKVGIVVATMREELNAIAEHGLFMRPYGFVEDTMMYENDFGCTRDAYVRMDDRLGKIELALGRLPELLKRKDVKRMGTATNFRYSMELDDMKRVYSTFAIYDGVGDSIVYVEEGELPLGMMVKMGLRNIF